MSTLPRREPPDELWRTIRMASAAMAAGYPVAFVADANQPTIDLVRAAAYQLGQFVARATRSRPPLDCVLSEVLAPDTTPNAARELLRAGGEQLANATVVYRADGVCRPWRRRLTLRVSVLREVSSASAREIFGFIPPNEEPELSVLESPRWAITYVRQEHEGMVRLLRDLETRFVFLPVGDLAGGRALIGRFGPPSLQQQRRPEWFGQLNLMAKTDALNADRWGLTFEGLRDGPVRYWADDRVGKAVKRIRSGDPAFPAVAEAAAVRYLRVASGFPHAVSCGDERLYRLTGEEPAEMDLVAEAYLISSAERLARLSADDWSDIQQRMVNQTVLTTDHVSWLVRRVDELR